MQDLKAEVRQLIQEAEATGQSDFAARDKELLFPEVCEKDLTQQEKEKLILAGPDPLYKFSSVEFVDSKGEPHNMEQMKSDPGSLITKFELIMEEAKQIPEELTVPVHVREFPPEQTGLDSFISSNPKQPLLTIYAEDWLEWRLFGQMNLKLMKQILNHDATAKASLVKGLVRLAGRISRDYGPGGIENEWEQPYATAVMGVVPKGTVCEDCGVAYVRSGYQAYEFTLADGKTRITCDECGKYRVTEQEKKTTV